ncbi:MAG: hypothetical protein QGH94_02720 [Phycisphaerae bacterium]|nr:hypothetical protein [Phycisphaerae bacterium]MDP7286888.1 hypothetical protein [Phycisphaerae bacterium]
MRLCFVIACMAGIGVGLVHLRKSENIARHELLQLEKNHTPRRIAAHDQESQLGYLTTPRQVSDRAKRMDIETERRPVHLAGPADRAGARNNRRVTN